MRFYPVFLNLERCDVLAVGLGGVGVRRVLSLAEARPKSILALDPQPSEEALRQLRNIPGLRMLQRAMCEADLAGKALVFAATDDQQENARIASLCLARNILCNVADTPAISSFFVPAKASAGGFELAVTTDGASPALAGRVGREAATWLAEAYGPLLTCLERLRPQVQNLGLGAEENRRILRSLVYSPLDAALNSKDGARARALLQSLLPLSLHDQIEELVHGLV